MLQVHFNLCRRQGTMCEVKRIGRHMLLNIKTIKRRVKHTNEVLQRDGPT